jgi:hypothetical protein
MLDMCTDQTGQIGCTGDIDIPHGDLCARRSEPLRNGPANALRTPGDDRNAARQIDLVHVISVI